MKKKFALFVLFLILVAGVTVDVREYVKCRSGDTVWHCLKDIVE